MKQGASGHSESFAQVSAGFRKMPPDLSPSLLMDKGSQVQILSARPM